MPLHGRDSSRRLPSADLVASIVGCRRTAAGRETRRDQNRVSHSFLLLLQASATDNNIISYLVDGNAYFLTATEISRRITFAWRQECIIVGIGYPITTSVFDMRRRAEDYTPPTKGGYDAEELAKRGNKRPDLEYGGASDFLDIIEKNIAPYVEEQVFPHLPLKTSRRMLFGHSFGGLFTLNALFTKPHLFDTFAAASPSIWWNDRSIVKEQEAAFVEGDGSDTKRPPRLLVTYGSLEQDPTRRPGEADEEYELRKRLALEKRMKGNAIALAGRLKWCPRLRNVWLWEFLGEDHGGAAPTALQRALVKFLDDFE